MKRSHGRISSGPNAYFNATIYSMTGWAAQIFDSHLYEPTAALPWAYILGLNIILSRQAAAAANEV